MVYLGFILISMLHLLDLHYARKKRGMNYKVFILNFSVSTIIIVLSFYYFINYGDEKLPEYMIIVAFLISIVAYIKLNINKFLK